MYYIQFDYNFIIFFYRDEDSDVNSKEEFIETANLIVKDSKEVTKIATQVAKLCTDAQLKYVSYSA